MNLTTIAISLFVFVVGPVWLTFFLRRRYPANLPLGLFLSFLFPLFSQLYLPKASTYIIVVFACGLALYKIGLGGHLLWGCTGLVSAALLYSRLQRK